MRENVHDEILSEMFYETYSSDHVCDENIDQNR